MNQTYDVIVVGAGLAGIVAATEAAARGRRVLLLDQEGHRNLGGQAYWSFGGLFLVDSPEQRRLGIHDSADLAWSDWLGSAQFDREVDDLPRQWARAYVDFAAGEKRAWLHAMGLRIFPWWAGPNAATAAPAGMATPCRDSISPGAPDRECWSRSCGACARGSTTAGSPWDSGTGWTSSSPATAR